MELIGRDGDRLLFSSGDMGVLIDEYANVVVSVDDLSALTAAATYEPADAAEQRTWDLAEAAATSLNINVLSTNDRMHTIPKAVQLEAKRALAWRAEHKRGGTPVGLNTARMLAEGGQIGIKKIRHIANYFPRHEGDKKGKGYSPGEDGYPSNGRIAWGLWGGDAAKKWAMNIVERENRKQNLSIIAANGYYDHEAPAPVDLASFDKKGSEFAVRVRRDGTGIDRLYQIEANGKVYVWDNGCWSDLGHINHDIATYDKSLDDPYDEVEKDHVVIDRESAVAVAALMDADPFVARGTDEINQEEHDLFVAAEPEIDWDAIDAVTAAGDGKYTPEERASNAKAQVRDARGRFAQMGSRVVVGGNPNYVGKIVAIDAPTKSAKVQLDDGKIIDVPVNTTEKADEASQSASPAHPTPAGAPTADTGGAPAGVNTEGILGKTKDRTRKSKARLPEGVETITEEELRTILREFATKVTERRNSRKEREDKPTTAAATPSEDGDFASPEQSDITPIYMAIVADDDPQAVMDLVALVPANASSTSPITFKRKPGKWERDDSILLDLNSPTPPPVVVLDKESLDSVMEQIDAPAPPTTDAASTPAPTPVTAAFEGGLDRNRGNAEKLRRYWLYGKGAAKIRWNTGGDWKRCVRHLAKYMGPRAKGYCALRHKEATGMWTGDKLHREMYGHIAASGEPVYSDAYILSTDEVIAMAALRARVADARSRVMTAGGIQAVSGSKFVIPLVIPEGVESGDGRIFDKGAIDIRELPLPLLWQIKTDDGHTGSVVVGRIDHMERLPDGGIGNAYGVFDSGPYGKEVERLVRGKFLRGVSADLDKFEADQETEDGEPNENGEAEKIQTGRMSIHKGRVMAVTIVPKPAFEECTIHIPEEANEQEDDMVPDGVYVEDIDAAEAASLIACGFVSSVIPTEPPSNWFENPNLTGPTPLTVDDMGRVFGHIAAWHVDHIGMAFGTKPPRSRSNYAYFHTGVVRTSEGTDVPVGQLTLAGGHASLEMSAQEAVRHYDDTASAIADVHAGEDNYGIWVAGALRPGTTPEQIRALRASAPSGDWRPIKGRLELVAVCQVNVPGFPISRARVASGQVLALVAAGASTLAKMKGDPIADLNARLDKLEMEPLTAAAEQAKLRVLSAKAEALSARVRKAVDVDPKGLTTGVSRETTDLPLVASAMNSDKSADELNLRERIALVEAMVAGIESLHPAATERLRQYWEHGAGAAKIRWGQPGDWKRCVRHLAKYMGPRAKGYCQLRHRGALGYYTSTHAKMTHARVHSIDAELSAQDLEDFGALYGDVPKFLTHVSDSDMNCPMDEIHQEQDDLFDDAWEPDHEIVVLLEDPNNLTEDVEPSVKEHPAPTDFAVAENVPDKKKRPLGEGVVPPPEEHPQDTDIKDLTPEEIEAVKAEKAAREQKKTGLRLGQKFEGKYIPGKTQPRDASGRFRTVLARLKSDLGVAGLTRVVDKVKIAENLDYAGDYDGAVKASQELLHIIDRLDSGALDARAISNVRASAEELGKVISQLPFNFDNQAQKIRYSDVPPALKDLMDQMIKRVEAKIGPKDAAEATTRLKSFMSGVELFSQADVSSEMSKLLRLLT